MDADKKRLAVEPAFHPLSEGSEIHRRPWLSIRGFPSLLPASAGEFGFKSFTEIISLQKRRNAMQLVWCLRNNYTFAAMDFGRRRGASDEHIPQWICKERATKPPPKRHAALRVALKLAWGFVAPSVEYRWGYTPSLAPRPRPNWAQQNTSHLGDTTLAPEVGRSENKMRAKSFVTTRSGKSGAH